MVIPPVAPSGTMVDTDSSTPPRLSEMPHTPSPAGGWIGTSVSGSGAAEVPSAVGSSDVSSTADPRSGDPRNGDPRKGAERSAGTVGPNTDRSRSWPAGIWASVTSSCVPAGRFGTVNVSRSPEDAMCPRNIVDVGPLAPSTGMGVVAGLSVTSVGDASDTLRASPLNDTDTLSLVGPSTMPGSACTLTSTLWWPAEQLAIGVLTDRPSLLSTDTGWPGPPSSLACALPGR